MKRRETILIADDSTINRTMLNEILRDTYHVIEASDGVECLSMLRTPENEISLVILDLVMPCMSGFDVLLEIHKDQALQNIPVIVVTSLSDIESEVRALNMGASEIILKPYDERIIRLRVNNLIQKMEAEQVRLEYILLKKQSQAQIHLQSILDNMLGGVALVEYGDKMRALYLSKGFYQLLGYNKKNYKPYESDMLKKVYQDDIPLLSERATAALKNHGPFECDYRTYTKTGELRWVHMQGIQISYPDSQLPVLNIIITDITEAKAITEQLSFRANHDLLTGIYNRHAFCEKTVALLNAYPNEDFVLIRWNIERFKVINDLFGSAAGDSILKKLASSFRSYMPPHSTYGRLEADHFVTCLPKSGLKLEHLLSLIENGVRDQKLNYSLIIGVGIYEIDDIDVPIDQMCDRANLALQTIKGNYMKHYAYYDVTLRETILQEQEILVDMESALDRNEFTIFLQPVYSLSQMEPISAEALVRWIHPTKGLLPPGLFIPLFERNGFIERLDRYVWDKTCRYLRLRQEEGLPEIPISVNISRVNLYNPHLCEDLIALVEHYGLNPQLLKLEITESAYTDNPEQLLKTMTALQSYGFLVLMDDFGSGYSSLNMLKDVPVDVLKIDMRFLGGLETSNRAGNILTSIVRMATWLNMPVIAEGVETKLQVDYLKSIGCDQIQGYYFSRPIPLSDFDQLIKNKYTSPA